MSFRVDKRKHKQSPLTLVFFALLSLAGCDKPESSTEHVSLLDTAKDASPVPFELRDFTQTHEVISTYNYKLSRFSGRGTLITRDSRLTSGRAEVWVRANSNERIQPTFTQQVDLQDGFGTVTTISTMNKAEGPPEFTNWTVLGYYLLKPAILVHDDAGSQTGAKQLKRTSLPRFQIRDYSQKDTSSLAGGSVVNGNGTLVALDESVKHGLYIVKLKAHKTNTSDTEASAQVTMRDGVGTFGTYANQDKQEAAKGTVKYSNWSVTGYFPISEGKVVSEADSQQTVNSHGTGKAGLFEMRDFVLKRTDIADLGYKVSGYGTLIAKNAQLKNENLIVWLKCHSTQYGGSSRHFTLHMRDGLATVTTGDLEFKSQPDSKVAYSDWQIIGYTKLLPSQMVQPASGK